MNGFPNETTEKKQNSTWANLQPQNYKMSTANSSCDLANIIVSS